LFLDGFVKPSDDKLYYIDLDNVIKKERKLHNRLDFTDESFTGTVTTVFSQRQAQINISGATGAVGDVIVFNNIISRITAVSGTGPTAIYSFAANITFEAADAVVLYRGIVSEIRTSPFFAGTVSNLKQFPELQMSFRNRQSCSNLSLYFVNDSTSTGPTAWVTETSTGGWGSLPWGSFPWGLEDGIELPFETSSSQPMRTYIPLEVQRGTYIQANITHKEAAQNIMIQNMAFTFRMYKQRTTK
jgi:hypothetical protein